MMLKHFYRLMVMALGLFVVSSCGEATPKYGNIYVDYDDATVDGDVQSDEDATENEFEDTLYGCPTAHYRIEGVVASMEGIPIKGIEVSAEINQYLSTPVVKSDSDGKFVLLQEESCPYDPHSDIPLTLVDSDGELNGAYQNKTVVVSLSCGSIPSGFGDYDCTNTDVKIELEEATSDDDVLLPDDDTLLKD